MERQWGDRKYIAVGLDPDIDRLPEPLRLPRGSCPANVAAQFLEFNRSIIDATYDVGGFYKINPAFYLHYGMPGFDAMQSTIDYIQMTAADCPVIYDGKFGGAIPKENRGYQRLAFGCLRAAAVTVHAYPGREAMQPFLMCRDKGIFVVCSTSGLGWGEFQASVDVCGDMVPGDYMPPYRYIAHRVASDWNENGNCGLVVGANRPDVLQEVRERVFEMPILSPAIGEQQEDTPLETQMQRVVTAGKYGCTLPMIICSSSSIIFASADKNYAEAARARTIQLNDLVNTYL